MLDRTFLIQEDTNVKEKDNNPIDMLYLATEIYESIFYYNENDTKKTNDRIKNAYNLFVRWMFQNDIILNFKDDYPDEFDNIFHGTIFSFHNYENSINFVYNYLLDIRQYNREINIKY